MKREKIWTENVYDSEEVNLKDLNLNDFCYVDDIEGAYRVASLKPLYLIGYEENGRECIASDFWTIGEYETVRRLKSLYRVGAKYVSHDDLDSGCLEEDYYVSEIVYIGCYDFVCECGLVWGYNYDIGILDTEAVCDGSLYRVCLEDDSKIVLYDGSKKSGHYMTISEAKAKAKVLEVYKKS